MIFPIFRSYRAAGHGSERESRSILNGGRDTFLTMRDRSEGNGRTSGMGITDRLSRGLRRGLVLAALATMPLGVHAQDSAQNSAQNSVLNSALNSAQTSAQSSANDSASSTVQQFQDALIEIMKGGDEMGFEGRREIVAAIVDETFDLPYITRLVVGSHWSTLDRRERDALSEAFVRMAIATLAARFNSYDGEEFVVAWERELKKQRMQVRGEFVFTDGEVVNIDYALHTRRGSWQIINIWFDGVSGTRIQHEEFDDVLATDGVDELIRLLDEKVAYYAGGGV